MWRKCAVLILLGIFILPENTTQSLDANGKRTLESQFATKTKYEHRIQENNSLPWTVENIPSHLKPILIDATLRHGTRFPSIKRVGNWTTIIQQFKSHVNNSKYVSNTIKSTILEWKNRFPDHLLYRLSKLGWEEHVFLGFKYYSMMPEIWSEILDKNGISNNHDFLVLSSRKIRVLASANAFLSSIQLNARNDSSDLDHPAVMYHERKVLEQSNQKNDQNIVIYDKISVLVNDSLLRFFDYCEKYLDKVKNNETAEIEFENFFKTKEILEILDRFPTVDNKIDIYYVYQLCAFETAVYNRSVWCDLFRENDFSVLEFASDLKHYYKTGPGYDVNVAQACHLLHHIMDRLNKKHKQRPRATLRFGHAETLIPLVSFLGFYQETEHLNCNSSQRTTDRVFQTGKISPFAGNLAIVVYESRGNSKNRSVSFAINEQIVKPFGLSCYFCDFEPDSVAYRELEKRLEGCESVCARDKKPSKGALDKPPSKGALDKPPSKDEL